MMVVLLTNLKIWRISPIFFAFTKNPFNFSWPKFSEKRKNKNVSTWSCAEFHFGSFEPLNVKNDSGVELGLEWLRFSLFDLFGFQIFEFSLLLKKWLRKSVSDCTRFFFYWRTHSTFFSSNSISRTRTPCRLQTLHRSQQYTSHIQNRSPPQHINHSEYGAFEASVKGDWH